MSHHPAMIHSRNRSERKRTVAFTVVAASSLALFALIAGILLGGGSFAYDLKLLAALHHAASAQADLWMHAISHLGQSKGVVPIDIAVLIYFVMRRRWRNARFWIAAVGGAALLNAIAKPFFARPRPDLWTALTPESSFSFPSSHAMSSMATMIALVLLLWPTRWRVPILCLTAVFVPMVGISRIYLGAHYPSDVLAGWLLAIAWVTAVAIWTLRETRTRSELVSPQTRPVTSV